MMTAAKFCSPHLEADVTRPKNPVANYVAKLMPSLAEPIPNSEADVVVEAWLNSPVADAIAKQMTWPRGSAKFQS